MALELPVGSGTNSGMRRVILLVFLCVIFVSGCDPGSDSGFPPIARLTLNPLVLPSGQNAEIVLDGRASCDELDHPEACDSSPEGQGPDSACPGGITFSWEIPFEYSTISATPNRAHLHIATRITSPQPVKLTVTDCSGLTHSVTRWVGVTIE